MCIRDRPDDCDQPEQHTTPPTATATPAPQPTSTVQRSTVQRRRRSVGDHEDAPRNKPLWAATEAELLAELLRRKTDPRAAGAAAAHTASPAWPAPAASPAPQAAAASTPPAAAATPAPAARALALGPDTAKADAAAAAVEEKRRTEMERRIADKAVRRSGLLMVCVPADVC